MCVFIYNHYFFCSLQGSVDVLFLQILTIKECGTKENGLSQIVFPNKWLRNHSELRERCHDLSTQPHVFQA